MGATYCSFQVETTHQDMVVESIQAFLTQNPHAIACYVGQALGAWVAVYPQFEPAMDGLAKHLSKAVDGLVLTLFSNDEDEVYFNFCNQGKDHSFFKIATWTKRPPKKQAPLFKKLALLSHHLTPQQQQTLVETLSDTRDILYSSDILRHFCQTVGIKNALTSYSYIQHGEYEQDLDVPTPLIHLA